jgi:hypothetical protein
MELFRKFFDDMLDEYMRHLPRKSDSWKACNAEELLALLQDSTKREKFLEKQTYFQELVEHPRKINASQCIDVALFSFFLKYHLDREGFP